MSIYTPKSFQKEIASLENEKRALTRALNRLIDNRAKGHLFLDKHIALVAEKNKEVGYKLTKLSIIRNQMKKFRI